MDRMTYNKLYKEFMGYSKNILKNMKCEMELDEKVSENNINFIVVCDVLKEKEGYKQYTTPLKNKNKEEFDWSTNQSCIDFHLIVDYVDNFYYSGSMCYNEFEYYNEDHTNEKVSEYSILDFISESKKAVRSFMNRKNKKAYEIDEHIGRIPITLWNYQTEQYNKLDLDLNLTYCP